jgi:serine/threonine protein phosphatase PrpC
MSNIVVLETMRNTVIAIVFVLHLAFCCCVGTSRVVAALQRYFYTECVFLLDTEDHSKYSAL